MSSGGPPQDNLDYVLRTVQNPQTPQQFVIVGAANNALFLVRSVGRFRRLH